MLKENQTADPAETGELNGEWSRVELFMLYGFITNTVVFRANTLGY